MAKNVHKRETPTIKLPIIAMQEDRGLKRCATPIKVLADINDTTSWRNDVTGISLVCDSLTIELEKPNGQRIPALGLDVDLPYQSNAKAFVIDWRQHIVNGKLMIGCYKVVVNYEISGIIGEYYYGAYKLQPFNRHTSKGTVRILSILNDVVRKDGINYKDSGFADSIRFDGSFGYMQPNYDIENVTNTDRVNNKVRNEAIRTFELRTDALVSCFTNKIEAGTLLKANQIFISEHNQQVHEEYLDFPVILNEEESPSFEYVGGVYATVKASFHEKVTIHESKYDGNIEGSANVLFQLPQGVQGGSGICQDGTVTITDSTNVTIGTQTVTSGGSETFAVVDSIINVDNHTWSVLATDTLDLEVVDDNGFSVPTTQNGNQIVVDMPPCVKDWLVLPYNTGDIFAATLDNSKVTGIVQSINSAFVTNLVIKKNGVVVTAPFTVADTDKIEAEFDAATSEGAIVLDMTGTFTFQINIPWYLTYLDTRDIVPVVCDATNTGTYTAGTGTNVGSIEISTDNVTYTPMTFPFTPTVGQIYYFKRSNFAVTGTYIIG